MTKLEKDLDFLIDNLKHHTSYSRTINDSNISIKLITAVCYKQLWIDRKTFVWNIYARNLLARSAYGDIEF